jgi:carboxyvinyl-carboxyphosphonate phosphorylmutase
MPSCGRAGVGSLERRAKTAQADHAYQKANFEKGTGMNWTERRERLRAIVGGGRCVFPASVYDGISARIAGELGFEAMMFAGSVGSFSVLAAPDLCVLTLTEFAEQAYRINRAGSLPLCVDADHGYGNALSVQRTVEELETAGVSALTIEDTLLPEAFGSKDTRLISIDEGVGKMRAALAGRQDPRLMIVGRTSAIGITGVDDTIARLNAYEAAGVDMLFLAGLKKREHLDAVSQAVKKPLFLGSVPEDMMDLDYLSARNVRVCLQGHHQFWAGVQGVHDALKALRAGTKPSQLKNVASADLQKKLLRQADYDGWSEKFLDSK